MHKDFLEKYPKFKGTTSYELYRLAFKEEKITIYRLGHEECESCEKADQHDPNHSRKKLVQDCLDCIAYSKHIKRAEEARKLYKFHATSTSVFEDVTFYSIDLQKVIMLPRLDSFKEVIFTKRISSYNESFAPMGTFHDKKNPIISVIWHEGIGGRKKENIISAYYKFFLKLRDYKQILLWVDNCFSQNENWTLLSFLVWLVNSGKTDIKTIDLYFFEAGHTFTLTDSFHHAVEKSLKRKEKVYDFEDIENCIPNSLSNVKTIEMNKDFFKLRTSFKSNQKIKYLNAIREKNSEKKFYLSQIKHLQANQGEMFIKYSTNYNEEQELKKQDFLKNSVISSGFPPLINQSNDESILKKKKDDIVEKLLPLMPENRRKFWTDFKVIVKLDKIKSNRRNRSKKYLSDRSTDDEPDEAENNIQTQRQTMKRKKSPNEPRKQRKVV